MSSPGYKDRRTKLLANVSKALIFVEGAPDFDSSSSVDKMQVLLGKRSGDPWVDRIDRWVKTHQVKCWNKRRPSRDAINSVLGVKCDVAASA